MSGPSAACRRADIVPGGAVTAGALETRTPGIRFFAVGLLVEGESRNHLIKSKSGDKSPHSKVAALQKRASRPRGRGSDQTKAT